jgi:hypothetical protein
MKTFLCVPYTERNECLTLVTMLSLSISNRIPDWDPFEADPDPYLHFDAQIRI